MTIPSCTCPTLTRLSSCATISRRSDCRWFRGELAGHGLRPTDHARLTQQRGDTPFRFSAFEEKVLWGDLADVFHLVYIFSPADDPVRNKLAEHHFDAIYLGERRMGFISEEFRSLMLEIWRVKYLQMPRFREVISSIPLEIRLSHFLNDGDSPDIPIPVYVEYLNQIRDLARAPADEVFGRGRQDSSLAVGIPASQVWRVTLAGTKWPRIVPVKPRRGASLGGKAQHCVRTKERSAKKSPLRRFPDEAHQVTHPLSGFTPPAVLAGAATHPQRAGELATYPSDMELIVH